jgi:hypothetical protein
MPIKSLEQRKRQKILLIASLGILIIAALILYFSFWQVKDKIPETVPLEAEEGLLPSQKERTILILEKRLKMIDLDVSFLNETILTFLKSHADLPIEKGETGRPNPFIPY